MPQQQLSLIALTFQIAGTALLAIIIAQLARTFSSRPARWWAAGWAAFSIGLVALRLSVTFASTTLRAVYLLLQWTFVAMLWIGCKRAIGRVTPHALRLLYWFPAAVAVSAALVLSTTSVDELFIVESVLVSLGVLASWVELGKRERTAATRSMRLSLLIFAALYVAYAPLFFIHTYVRPLPLLSFSSFVDMLACILVGCVMIMLITEETRDRLAGALANLESTRSLLEQRLFTDALTEAFNRHAFHCMQQGTEVATTGSLSGVVVMFDLDNLKRINDRYGHAAGDVAIRTAANAIRAVIRGDDLLFRWGGDEFVAILPNLSGSAVAERLQTFHEPIAVHLGDGSRLECRLSYGLAEFDAQQPMDSAIKLADSRMYSLRPPR